MTDARLVAPRPAPRPAPHTTPETAARYAVVTCSDATMLPAAACALLSAHRNCGVEGVAFYLVGSDLTAADRDRLDRFLRAHGLAVTLIETRDDNVMETALGRFGKAAISRLHLPALLPQGFERVLYLDADILVTGDLGELLRADMAGRPLAVVEVIKTGNHDELARRKRRLGMAEDSAYFNSGVLLIDWPRELAEGGFARAYEMLRAGGEFPALDQDALNAVFDGRWQPLDHVWNMRGDYAWLLPEARIIHFAGPGKPWLAGAEFLHRRTRRLYRSYLQGHWDAFVRVPRGRERGLLGLGYPLTLLKRLRRGRRIARQSLAARP